MVQKSLLSRITDIDNHLMGIIDVPLIESRITIDVSRGCRGKTETGRVGYNNRIFCGGP
jgi:hypothetical protein